eukprot:scaffold19953_cov95-Isochrysis_galbana.AAC.1
MAPPPFPPPEVPLPPSLTMRPSPCAQVLEPNWHVLNLKMRVATSVDELMRLHAHFLDASLKARTQPQPRSPAHPPLYPGAHPRPPPSLPTRPRTSPP